MPNQIGRWILSLIDSGVRLAALAFIWLATAFLIGPLSWGFGFGYSGFYSFLVIFLVLPVALLLSHFIMQRKLLVQDAPVQSVKTIVPPQTAPQSLSTRDLMALLDEDDLDDLRAEVRETLRSRIQRLSADDVDSFEDLLADTGKRKRGVR
jgi:hypothetical protein